MPPSDMFALAGESDLTFNLDRQAREAAITNAAKENITQKLFINFLPSVIYNPEVCLKTTTDLIKKYNFKLENIIFEVVESEEELDFVVSKGVDFVQGYYFGKPTLEPMRTL